jgi:hypothetical protein
MMLMHQHVMIGFRRGFLGDMFCPKVKSLLSRFRKQTSKFVQFFERIHDSSPMKFMQHHTTGTTRE